MAHSVAEQLILELVNRARMDPLGEAARQGISLDQGLTPGRISTDPKQVLAPNSLILTASRDHGTWILDNNTFSHSGPGGNSPGDRMRDAGYNFTGSWTWGENLARAGSSAGVDPVQIMYAHHNGLYASPGHRTNIFNAAFREAGFGQALGNFNGMPNSVLVEKFAASGSARFLTGVVIHDADGDLFYTPGEGRGGVQFAGSNGQGAVSANAGGYALRHDTASAVTVTVTAAGQTTRLEAQFGTQNIKLDVLVNAQGQAERFLTSGNITLLDGVVRDVALLGIADASLGGGSGNDLLTGNSGHNLLTGGGGNDTLFGGAGNDTLRGDGGDDVLYGDTGNDELRGGAGNDTLFGGSGRDQLFGDAGDDLLFGGAGNDRLSGGNGNDTLDGGAGDDRLSGGRGRDRLIGGDGNDTLNGGEGRDTLIGGAGRDVLTGGAGADVFVFARIAHIGRGENSDRITDFESGLDRIDLRGLDLSFDGRRFSGEEGSIRFRAVDGNGQLQIDSSGNGKANAVLILDGITSFDSSDLLL